jgi:hypothetical protein
MGCNIAVRLIGEKSMAMFHEVQSLGPKQSLLANGSLICKDVVIARTGIQQYDASERRRSAKENGGP